MSAIATLLNAIKAAHKNTDNRLKNIQTVVACSDYFKEKRNDIDVIIIIATPDSRFKLSCSNYDYQYPNLWAKVDALVRVAKKSAKSDFMLLEFMPAKGTAIPHDLNHV